MLVHTVYFYFKESVSEEQIAANIEGARELGKIETVKEMYVGTQADVTIRPVSVTGWKFSITVLLANVPDHDIYQDHPIHLDYIAKYKDLWEKVTVFDAD
ncbi:MAG: Dabb family protein [Verrucomicrobiota bacterium]